MKKILILVLFFIPFLFQNCTKEMHEINAVVGPEFEDLIVINNQTLEGLDELYV